MTSIRVSGLPRARTVSSPLACGSASQWFLQFQKRRQFCHVGDAQNKFASGLKIVCFGDSITAGYHSGGRFFEPYGKTMSDELQSLGCDVTVHVNGLSGLTAKDMAAKSSHPTIADITGKIGRGLDVILNEQPDLVIIMAGTNDLGAGLSAQTILADVCRLHEACHSRGIPTVALAPSTVAHGPTTLGREQLATLLGRWSKATPSVVACIDMMELVPHMGPSPLWDFDGLHLSASGSKTLGRGLSRKLKDIVTSALSRS